MGNYNMSWKDLLSKKNIDKNVIEKFIGFISWQPDNIYPKLGKEITDILTGYTGNVIAIDVYCEKYNTLGLLFVNKTISIENAEVIFNTIISYENEEIYNK